MAGRREFGRASREGEQARASSSGGRDVGRQGQEAAQWDNPIVQKAKDAIANIENIQLHIETNTENFSIKTEYLNKAKSVLRYMVILGFLHEENLEKIVNHFNNQNKQDLDNIRLDLLEQRNKGLDAPIDHIRGTIINRQKERIGPMSEAIYNSRRSDDIKYHQRILLNKIDRILKKETLKSASNFDELIPWVNQSLKMLPTATREVLGKTNVRADSIINALEE